MAAGAAAEISGRGRNVVKLAANLAACGVCGWRWLGLYAKMAA